MIDPYWRVEDADPDVTAAGETRPALVSLHFLLAAVRRRWRFWVGLGCLGMVLGVAWTFVMPYQSTGTTTLLLTHDPNTEPTQAMATDVSLLRTRTVANAVIDELGLQMTPEEFQNSLTATPVSSTILVLEIPGPSDEAAVERAKVLSDNYFDFRTEQIQSQSKALVSGYEKRVASLQRESDGLTKQYETLSVSGPDGRSQATDVLAQRSQLNSEISSLRQTIQDTSLKSSSIIAASHVLDPASVVPHSTAKRTVLATASGLIGGLAVGIGLVLFTAVTSDRLRRRDEVALALDVPVRFTVVGLGQQQPWRRIRRGSSDARDLQVLVQGLDGAVFQRRKATRKGRATRLALGAVASDDAAERVLGSLTERLTSRGKTVFLVDLSESGRLEDAVKKAFDQAGGRPEGAAAPLVFRPEGVPSLARGPVGSATTEITDLPETDPRRPAWNAADVVLTLAEVNPAVGVDHLKSWADQMVLLVAAGGASAERLRSTADLIRSAGLKLLFAMMVGTDQSDESLGMPDTSAPGWPGPR